MGVKYGRLHPTSETPHTRGDLNIAQDEILYRPLQQPQLLHDKRSNTIKMLAVFTYSIQHKSLH
jgi:hypothetical protein